MSIRDGKSRSALVLAGAGAKGAFEAGCIDVLARAGIPLSSVVGSSAGALNAAYYAAAIRAAKEKDAAANLVDFWIEEAQWRNFIAPSVSQIVKRRGFSATKKLERLVRARLGAFVPGGRHEVELRIVATALGGLQSWTSKLDIETTHEYVRRFGGSDFDDSARLDEIAHLAVASAAVPGLFAPVFVPDVGDCVDGGIVNVAPLRLALEDPTVDRIFVVVPWPSETDASNLSGARLAMHLVDILVGERLHRDLETVGEVNRRLGALERLAAANAWSDFQFRQFKEAVGLHCARPISIVPMRPDIPLAGNPFTALRSKGLRRLYVRYGRTAAERALSHHIQ